MPILISSLTRVPGVGTKPKDIDEVVGRVNSATDDISVAHMHSPQGWEEPGQTPEFQEITYVLRGAVLAKHRDGEIRANAGQAIIANPGEWIQYSTPFEGGASYISVCVPAFSIETVHRD